MTDYKAELHDLFRAAPRPWEIVNHWCEADPEWRSAVNGINDNAKDLLTRIALHERPAPRHDGIWSGHPDHDLT